MAQEEGDVTTFGTVTSDRLIYYTKRGWFSGGSREDIPLRHVTSVRLENRRRPIFGVFLALVALICLAVGSVGILIAIVPLGLAILLLWGSPLVMVNTAGGDLRPASGLPWTRPEAERFVTAVRRRLFEDPSNHSRGA